MGVLRTVVVLAAWDAGQQLALKGDRAWYEHYFFNPAYGQASYWSKQSDNDVILDGHVVDWAFFKDQNPTLTNRTDVANYVIRALEADRHVSFIGYDLVIIIVGVPDNVKTDGGSTTAQSMWRTHAAVVARVDDRFDFVAHEIGHALGLQHSYGDISYKNSSWSQQGEYGHPYCVMSAMGYGGISGPYVPPVPRNGRKEFTGLGPSLNAATALARGWIDAFHYDPHIAPPTQITLRSRHWGGRNPQLHAQCVNVVSGGPNYVIEYRESAAWDMGQGTPMLIVSHGRGSTADLAHPDTHSATFLRALRLPITFGGIGSTYQGPGFGLQILDRSAAHHTITFKIYPGRAPLSAFNLTSELGLVREALLEEGETNFDRGEILCADGVWPYRKVSQAQVVTFEATYALAVPPITASWTVDDEVLTAPGGTVHMVKSVKVASATLGAISRNESISLRYEIAPLPFGSRLRLYNDPNDERYSVDVGVTLSTDVGSGSASDVAKFEGIKYAYPPEFEAARRECIANFQRIADRYLRYKVLLPPEIWKRVPEERFVEVRELVDALSHFRSVDDPRGYEQVLAVLHEEFDVEAAQVSVVPLSDFIETVRPEYQPELLDPASRDSR